MWQQETNKVMIGFHLPTEEYTLRGYHQVKQFAKSDTIPMFLSKLTPHFSLSATNMSTTKQHQYSLAHPNITRFNNSTVRLTWISQGSTTAQFSSPNITRFNNSTVRLTRISQGSTPAQFSSPKYHKVQQQHSSAHRISQGSTTAQFSSPEYHKVQHQHSLAHPNITRFNNSTVWLTRISQCSTPAQFGSPEYH